MVAGYYYINKITKDGVKIKEEFWWYVKKLLVVYSIWSVIYIVIEFIQEFNNGLNIISFLKQILQNYFIGGSYYHLWFFPALFFSIIVVTFFVKMKKLDVLAYISIILYVIGCLGSSYFEIGNHIPVLNKLFNFSNFTLIRRILLMGLPFFVMGYFVKKFQNKNKENKKIKYMLIFSIIGFVLEIILVNYLNIQKNIIVTLFLYTLVFYTINLLLNNPMPTREKAGKTCRGMANFVYYSHPLFILILNKTTFLQNTLVFIFTVALTSIIGYIIVKVNNKITNKLIY